MGISADFYNQTASIKKEFSASNGVTLTAGSNGTHLVTEAYSKDTYTLKAKYNGKAYTLLYVAEGPTDGNPVTTITLDGTSVTL